MLCLHHMTSQKLPKLTSWPDACMLCEALELRSVARTGHKAHQTLLTTAKPSQAREGIKIPKHEYCSVSWKKKREKGQLFSHSLYFLSPLFWQKSDWCFSSSFSARRNKIKGWGGRNIVRGRGMVVGSSASATVACGWRGEELARPPARPHALVQSMAMA
jgi:hypothetical protein